MRPCQNNSKILALEWPRRNPRICAMYYM